MPCSEITAQKVRGCRRLLLSLNYNVVGTYTYLPSDGLDHLIRNTRIEETEVRPSLKKLRKYYLQNAIRLKL